MNLSDRKRTAVELKLDGQYVYCEVIEWQDNAVTVRLPSGQIETFPLDRIVG